MRRNGKKWKALVAAVALCVGMAGMTAPMQTFAAETPDWTLAVAGAYPDGPVVVETTQRCSIWSAPATMEENRVKYVDAGYQIQVYPQTVASELADGKTFYRTIKGAYVLCRCVGVGTATESGVENENTFVSNDNGVLVPIGSSAPVNKQIDWGLVEVWYSEVDDEGILREIGLWNYGVQDIPVVDSFGITYRGYQTQEAMKLVAQVAAGNAEIAQFLMEHGKRIMICNAWTIYDSYDGPYECGHSYIFGGVECQRGECICILIPTIERLGMDYGMDEVYMSTINDLIYSVMQNED